jgi:hypothetical protein
MAAAVFQFVVSSLLGCAFCNSFINKDLGRRRAFVSEASSVGRSAGGRYRDTRQEPNRPDVKPGGFLGIYDFFMKSA